MEQQSKSKPVTTSVPSISIRFHANAEQLEELYASDDDHTTNESSIGSTGTPGGEPDSSPLKYLPRLVKRSTSIDITPATNIDASPPSDPWRFFSDIKGKITKSVEEKITEIKARNQDEGSPLKNKSVKDSKDNSSVSDSEDLSESSISKTCGIVSTTEGAEMSSDDDTPSIEKDKKTEDRAKSARIPSSGLRQRFRLLKSKSAPREGTVSKKSLASLYNINSDKIEQALPEESEIESAVDALEDTNLNITIDKNELLKNVEEQFDNIKIDKDSVITIKEVPGNEVKQLFWNTHRPKTVYSPSGFVDFREVPRHDKHSSFLPIFILSAFAISYFLVHSYSNFLGGLIMGITVTVTYFYMKCLLDTPITPHMRRLTGQDIVEVQAVNEIQPLMKHEGWVNELPDLYNPHTYHISQTQSVSLRLQGNLLRVSHTKTKVPKRALWNEPKIKPTFTHHRVYNLLGATVSLLPDGLAKKRHWSKKYPICITLNKDQMDFESTVETQPKVDEEEITPTVKPKRSAFTFGKKKRYSVLRFSKLTEENEEYEMDSENSRASTPSPPSPDDSEEAKIVDDDTQQMLDEALQDSLSKEEEHEGLLEEDFDTLPEDWDTFPPPEDDSSAHTKLFIFGRTDREKEDWFRRLKAATHKGVNSQVLDRGATSVSHTLIERAITESDYAKYMYIFNKIGKLKESSEETPSVEIQWINVLVGRVLFDCFRDDNFTQKVKDRIQRKLSSIKLPYFIEELVVTELSLGRTPPLIHRAGTPVLDERGLWIDLDITYEGLVVLILQTKLNLMKLKTPHAHEESKDNERSAMFNSDVEDSAESTSDEESMCVFAQNAPALDATGVPVQGLGGTSNTSKKFMKMVNSIAESKFFQAATEYRYIKKAMEGVSNTDLRLKVEVRELVGTLVLNVPPPPSDRVWVGFRPVPDLALSAQPIVGERNITFLRITSWIEKKLLQEFQKLMVIPNMEDLTVPVMSSDLPQ